MEYIENKNSKQVTTIDLSRIKNQYGEIGKFGRQLISGLGEEIIKFRTQDELLYNILKEITPISRDLKYSHDSIVEACSRVLSHFKTENGSTIKLLDCLRRVHTPAPWGGTKGMYPESNTLPEQHTPAALRRGMLI